MQLFTCPQGRSVRNYLLAQNLDLVVLGNRTSLNVEPCLDAKTCHVG